MMFHKKLGILGIYMSCLIVLTGLTGCANTFPTLTATQKVVDKTLAAITKVKSYSLNTDIINTDKNIQNTTIETTEWKGTKLVDVFNQEMGMNMTITDEGFFVGGFNISLEMYIKGGKEYYKNIDDKWTKIDLTGNLWNRETQIPYLNEILKTVTRFNSLENEKINGVDCYVMTIIPSVQAIIDFVVSQEQPLGSQINIMWGGSISVVRSDAYKSGSIKLWVNRSNYLPVRIEVNADFQGNVGGGSISTTSTPYTPILILSVRVFRDS